MTTDPVNIQESQSPQKKELSPTEAAIQKYQGRKWQELRLVGEGESRHLEVRNTLRKIFDVVFSLDWANTAQEYDHGAVINFIEGTQVSREIAKDKMRTLQLLKGKHVQHAAENQGELKSLGDLLTQAAPFECNEIVWTLLERVKNRENPFEFEFRGNTYIITNELENQIKVSQKDSKHTILVSVVHEIEEPTTAAGRTSTQSKTPTTKFSAVCQDEKGRRSLISSMQDTRLAPFNAVFYSKLLQ